MATPIGYQQKGNALIIGLIVVIVAVGAYLIWSSQKSDQSAETNTNAAEENDDANQNEEVIENVNDDGDTADGLNVNLNVNANVNLGNDNGNTNSEPTVKTFTVAAKNFSFDLAEIRVKKGDKVKITLNNVSGFHDFVLDAFNVRTKQMQSPYTETIEFTADKTGTFEYYCSVGTHRAMGMKGNLIVE